MKISFVLFIVTLLIFNILNISDYFITALAKNTANFKDFLIFMWNFFAFSYLPFGLACSIVLYFFSLPIQNIYDNFVNGQEVKNDDLTKGKKRIKQIPYIIIVSLFTAMVGGNIKYNYGKPFTFDIFYSFVFMLTSAGLYSFLIISIINLLLNNLKEYMKIYTIEEKSSKKSSLKSKLILLIILFSANTSSFLLMQQFRLFYNYTDNQKNYNPNYNDQNEIKSNNDKDSIKFMNAKLFNFFVLFNFILFFLTVANAVIQYIYSLELTFQLKLQQINLNEFLKKGGDLTKKIAIVYDDEIGRLSSTINGFVGKITEILKSIFSITTDLEQTSESLNNDILEASTAVEEITSSSNQIDKDAKGQNSIIINAKDKISVMLDYIKKISVNMENLSNFVIETSSSMQETAGSIKSVNEITNKTNDLARELLNSANEGEKSLIKSIDAIKKIKDVSAQVMDIINMIKDIASKTDMLAMNAAIEAAHAGQYGKGFAVVADEVRQLAENSTEQVRQIEQYIQTMLQTVDNGVNMSHEAGQSFKRIVDYISKTGNLISEVSQAMNEQSNATTEIISSVSTVVNSTEEIRELTEKLQNQSSEIEMQISDIINMSAHISNATSEQSIGINNIQNLVIKTKDISSKNLNVINSLKQIMGDYKY
jgi:methyl-accepting chemotaxis protein